jgi:hypothetical protein
MDNVRKHNICNKHEGHIMVNNAGKTSQKKSLRRKVDRARHNHETHSLFLKGVDACFASLGKERRLKMSEKEG